MNRLEPLKPKVFRHRDGKFLIIVYNNREETYDRSGGRSFAEISKEQESEYTRYDSERLCRDSSMNEVHYSDEMKTHGLVCVCNNLDPNFGTKGCTCKLVDDNDREIQKLKTDYVELIKNE